MSWVTVASSVSLLGAHRRLVREMAAYVAREQRGRVRGILRWPALVVLGLSACLAAVGIGLTRYALDLAPEIEGALSVAFAVFPLTALLVATGAAQRGLLRVLSGRRS